MQFFKTPFNELPFDRKVAIVEVKKELAYQYPDSYKSSLKSFYRAENSKQQRIKHHVEQILKLRK